MKIEGHPYRVYFSRAMDGINPEIIRANGREVASILATRGLEIIDPFIEVGFDANNMSIKELASRVVERDLDLLKVADAVLMDCSLPKHSYIGCICELVYAHLWKIPVVVYAGSSGNESRYWLQYHAARVTKTRNDAIIALTEILPSAEST